MYKKILQAVLSRKKYDQSSVAFQNMNIPKLNRFGGELWMTMSKKGRLADANHCQ